MSKLKVAVVGVLAVAAVGCGGGAIAREDVNSELYRSLCNNYAKCGIASSTQGCLDLLTPYLTGPSSYDPYGPLIEAGKVKYDGVQAKRCVDAYATLACSTTYFTEVVEDCRLVYQGQVAVGGGCGSIECVPSAWCSPQPVGGCPGSCQARVAEGGSAKSYAECAVGLVLINGVCAKPGVEGAACGEMIYPSSCASGLFCASDTKTCKKYKLEGESCSSTALCTGYISCSNGICTTPGGLGASCGLSTSGGLSCKIDLVCDLSKAAPVCTERLSEGATCRSLGGSECKSPLKCVSGQGTSALSCQTPGTAGQGCVPGSCGAELYCESTSKTCQTQLVGGSTCTQSDSCKGGYCSSGVCKNLISTAVCQ